MYNYWNSFLQRSRHQCYVMGIDIFIFNIIHSKRISYHSFNFVCVCVWVSTMTTNWKANTTTTDAKKIRKNKNRCFLGFSTSNGVRVSIRFYSGFLFCFNPHRFKEMSTAVDHETTELRVLRSRKVKAFQLEVSIAGFRVTIDRERQRVKGEKKVEKVDLV